ncbi:MAG: carbohydrate porin [Planctomycetes bacterium]|nr:carbohydrate porin [Planctomycetota bacterium]
MQLLLSIVVAACLLARASIAQGILPVPDYAADAAKPWSLREHLSGDWGGHRASLAQEGIQFGLSYSQLAQSVVDGGRDSDTEWGSRVQAQMQFDLDRMGAVPGGLVTVKVESRFGSSVNGASGALLPVADMLYFPLTDERDEDIAATITEALYTQFVSKELAFFAGKFTILGNDANEFAGGDGTTQFLGHPFTSASVASLFNPYSTIGAGVLVLPEPGTMFSMSLYASQDSSTTIGVDTLDEGLVWATAYATQYELGSLPGGLRATYQYAFDREFVDLSGRLILPPGLGLQTHDDSWCGFLNAWQYLSVEGAGSGPIDVNNGRADREGVGLFARAGFADADTNPIEWTVSGGIGAKGLLEGRELDTLGIGYAYSETSSLPFPAGFVLNDTASRFEAFYDLALTPGAELTLDVQVSDSLLKSQNTASLLGVRLRLQF